MPIAFLLLFVFVFGGAIDTGTGAYIDYLLPGILLITIASGVSYTAYRLFLDLQSGIFERFQSMPIARSAVLWAHVLTSLVAIAISVVVVILAAVAHRVPVRAQALLAWLGRRRHPRAVHPGADLARGHPGADRRSRSTAPSAFSYPLIFLPFISSAFVPTETMPGPVRAFAENQPVTVDRRRHPQPARGAAGRQRHLGRPWPGASRSSWWPTGSRCSSTGAGPPDPAGRPARPPRR